LLSFAEGFATVLAELVGIRVLCAAFTTEHDIASSDLNVQLDS
jgi:hypothetical protein